LATLGGGEIIVALAGSNVSDQLRQTSRDQRGVSDVSYKQVNTRVPLWKSKRLTTEIFRQKLTTYA
jgi:hypothetical protein